MRSWRPVGRWGWPMRKFSAALVSVICDTVTARSRGRAARGSGTCMRWKTSSLMKCSDSVATTCPSTSIAKAIRRLPENRDTGLHETLCRWLLLMGTKTPRWWRRAFSPIARWQTIGQSVGLLRQRPYRPREQRLRRFLSKKNPSFWSFRPSAALPTGCMEPPCARKGALPTNENPAQSGFFFSGNRLNRIAKARVTGF